MNLEAWKYYLQFEENISSRLFLNDGIEHGFAIIDEDADISPYHCYNYRSVLYGEAFQCIDKLIQCEIDQGKYIYSDHVLTCVHSLGAVPKGDGSFRPITDCKQPLGLSINNYMNTTHLPFNCVTVDHVSSHLSKDCFMATVDISSAYRAISLKHEHWTYQGIEWLVHFTKQHLIDTRTCFGLKCAPFIFTQITNFIVRTMARLGYGKVCSYIDDFIVFGESRDECLQAQTTLMRLLGDLGFIVSWKKCCPPMQKVRYLGIDFDSRDLT